MGPQILKVLDRCRSYDPSSDDFYFHLPPDVTCIISKSYGSRLWQWVCSEYLLSGRSQMQRTEVDLLNLLTLW